MPWTAEDATRHDKDANTPKKQRQWAHVANSTLKKLTGEGVDKKDAESRAIRAANNTVEATFYRDPDYGALAILERAKGVLEVYSHNFMDRAPVERILHAQAKLLSEDGPSTRWQPKVHKAIVLANIDRALRDGGYSDDALGERAILQVPEHEAIQPDLPEVGHARVSEAVERAISQQLDTALSQVELPGKVQGGVLEAFPRPNTKDSMGRNLPFFRARAEVRVGKAGLGEGTCASWREALSEMGEALVRATITVEDGLAVFEAAVRPSLAVVEAFESLALPAFEQQPLSGSREIHIRLQEPLSEDDLEFIRERAAACTGAVSLEAIDPQVVLARVPSMLEGHHLGDPAFRERTNWLVQEFVGYGGELGWVGLMKDKHGQVLESQEPQANLPQLSERVKELRQAGYSEDEIQQAAQQALGK